MGWLRQTLTVGANPNVMLPFFTCAGYSPQQCSSKHIFVLETALLLDSWRIDPVFGTGTGWTFCYIQMAWQLRDNNLFWMYVFFLFGGCWMLLFSPRKAQFYTNDLMDLREMVKGSFFNGSFKRRGLFLQSEPKRRLLGILYLETLPFASQIFFFQRCTTESVMRLY